MLDFRSKARQQLLAYYFTNPTARHHLRDLAERLSLDPSNLSKELGRLERDGLFRSEMSGRQKYFQLNREYPLFNEVRKIVAKTIGAAPLIAQSLRRIEGIDEAYLYGSFARNQQDAASDIDVLVIGTARALLPPTTESTQLGVLPGRTDEDAWGLCGFDSAGAVAGTGALAGQLRSLLGGTEATKRQAGWDQSHDRR